MLSNACCPISMTSVTQLEGIYFALVMQVAAYGPVRGCTVRAWCHLTLVDCKSPLAPQIWKGWKEARHTEVKDTLRAWFSARDCALPICERLSEEMRDGEYHRTLAHLHIRSELHQELVSRQAWVRRVLGLKHEPRQCPYHVSIDSVEFIE